MLKMNNPGTMLMNMIMNNPQMMQKINANARTKEMFEILQAGDAKRGEELANNLLNTYGLNRNQAVNQASQGLQNMFGVRF